MSRFRWTTIQRALDVLKEQFDNASMVALIEDVGAGPEYDRLAAPERTTPKLRNLLSRLAREDGRTDADGTSLGDRFVQEAAKTVPQPEVRSWDTDPPYVLPHHAALLRSLAVDGWEVSGGALLPVAAVPLNEARSRLRTSLEKLNATEALSRLDQLEAGLDEGHWESANGDVRGFLNSVFNAIADVLPATAGKGLKEGEARVALQRAEFFRPASGDPAKSFEGDLVRAMMAFLGSDGAHSGTSDADASAYRYALAVLTADHFLQRVKARP